MMTQEQTSDPTFAGLVENLYRERMPGVNDPFAKLQGAAWMEFQKLGLPGLRDEVFRYVPLRKLYSRQYVEAPVSGLTKEAIAPWVLPECSDSFIVFVNGVFCPELSNRKAVPSQVVIEPIAKAFRTYGSFITNTWQKSLASERDPFVLLNSAVHSEGAFIYIPPKLQLSRPLQILSMVDAQDQSALITPRWHLYAGAQSQVEIVTREKVLSGASIASVGAFELLLDENAHVRVNQLAVSEHSDSWHLQGCRAYLKRNSTLDAVALLEGGETVRLDWKVALAGENAEANLSGLGLYDEKHEGHVHVLVEHQAPYCRSMQLYKNVLRGSSRSSFEGKIYVHKAAQKTDAYQMNKNLILSKGSLAYSKPNLEIFADDVKASHGATVGQLDEEQLFYLLARGLDRKTAENVLINGFCSEVIEKITVGSILNEVGIAAAAYIASK